MLTNKLGEETIYEFYDFVCEVKKNAYKKYVEQC